MFNTPTVFVLGAGASWHYGYPTGEELVRLVVHKATELEGFFNFPAAYKNRIVPKFISGAGVNSQNHLSNGDLWIRRGEEAGKLAQRLKQANPTVIDFFLKQNPDLHEIGKLAIAMVIFDCEAQFDHVGGNPNHIKRYERQVLKGQAPVGLTINASAFDDDWVRFVIYKLASRCEQSDHLFQNKVSFITFNYDVSLEQRLHRGLRSISLFKETDIEKFLSSDRIIHVYGKVRGHGGWQENPLKSYLPRNSDPDVLREAKRVMDLHFQASQGMQTIDGPEKIADGELLAACDAAISSAHKLFILGYGFDGLNSDRIGLSKINIKPTHDRAVYFTNFSGLNRVSMAASRIMFGGYDSFLPPNPAMKSSYEYVEHKACTFRWEMSLKNVYDALNEDFESLETD